MGGPGGVGGGVGALGSNGFGVRQLVLVVLRCGACGRPDCEVVRGVLGLFAVSWQEGIWLKVVISSERVALGTSHCIYLLKMK